MTMRFPTSFLHVLSLKGPVAVSDGHDEKVKAERQDVHIEDEVPSQSSQHEDKQVNLVTSAEIKPKEEIVLSELKWPQTKQCISPPPLTPVMSRGEEDIMVTVVTETTFTDECAVQVASDSDTNDSSSQDFETQEKKSKKLTKKQKQRAAAAVARAAKAARKSLDKARKSLDLANQDEQVDTGASKSACC